MSKAYLLPDDPNPPGDRCVIVFIPDDPGFFRAFMGSLTGLEYWGLHERDAAKTAAVVAQRWKRANQRTLNTLEVTDCQLIEELLEDDDMAINVNVSCGGGCGVSDTHYCLDTTNPPRPETWPTEDEVPDFEPTDFEDTGSNVPPGAVDREEYDAMKCRAARKLALDFQATILSLETLGGIAAIFGAAAFAGSAATPYVVGAITAVAGVFGIAISLPGIMVLFLAAVAVLVTVGITTFGYFSLVATELDIEQLTCHLYKARTIQEARDAYVFHTNKAVTTLAIGSLENGNIFITVLLKLVDYLLPDEVLSILFKVAAWHRENLLEPFDCSNCNAVIGAWAVTSTTGSNDPDLEFYSPSLESWEFGGDMVRGGVIPEQIYIEATPVGYTMENIFAVSFKALAPISPAPTASQGVRYHPNGLNIEAEFQSLDPILVYLEENRPPGIPPFTHEFSVTTHNLLAPFFRIEFPGGTSPFTVSGSMVEFTLYDAAGDIIDPGP